MQAHVYDNSRGSALWALARAGMLPTRSLKHHFDPAVDETCMRCGMAAETMHHVIAEFNEGYFSEEDLNARLGFGETASSTLTYRSKRLLESWEKETRNIR